MSNKITAIGRVTRAPEVKFTAAGVAVASFSIAWNDRIKSATGEWSDGPAHFLDVSAWRALGEQCADLAKGTRVVVVGELKSRTWERDGERRTGWQVEAEDVGVLLDRFARSTAPRPSADPWAQADTSIPF